jgi:hypothetical protein
MSATLAPQLLNGLCDDAAVFPPGSLPLDRALVAHLRHRSGAHSALVGPLVLAAKDLEALTALVGDLDPGSVDLALTVPLVAVAPTLRAVAAVPQVRLEALEVALDAGTAPDDAVPALREALLAGDPVPEDLAVYVEVPRHARRDGVLSALAGTELLAKFRTGGVTADLYPDEDELAASVVAAVAAGVPFKATAGLHHAVRNTDPATGFEQHGFLNLLAATGAALRRAPVAKVAEVLADRDGASVARRVGDLPVAVRDAFRSFGTCSVAEPVVELADLGLLDPTITEDLA